MCGIYGVIGIDAKKYEKIFYEMGKQLSHRGPDFQVSIFQIIYYWVIKDCLF